MKPAVRVKARGYVEALVRYETILMCLLLQYYFIL